MSHQGNFKIHRLHNDPATFIMYAEKWWVKYVKGTEDSIYE